MRSQLLLLFFFLNSYTGNAQKLHDKYLDSAERYVTEMKFYLAESCYEKALKESRKSNNSLSIANDLVLLGQNNKRLILSNQALENFFSALKIIESKKLSDTLAFTALLNVSLTFSDLEDINSSRVYGDRAHAIAKRRDDPVMLSNALANYGKLERLAGNYQESVRYYLNAIEILPDSLERIRLDHYIGLSTAYVYSKEFPNALECLEKASLLSEELNNTYYRTIILGQIGATYQASGKLELALDSFLEGLAISKKENYADFIQRFSRELARTYYKKGDYKTAYVHYAEFVKVFQDQTEKRNVELVYEMSAKYELDKKEEEISYLETQRQLETQLYQGKLRQRNQIILFASLLGLFAFSAIYWILRVQKKRREVAQKLVEKEGEVRKQQAILEGQDMERNRLSSELHDGLGGTLASIKMRLSDQQFEQQERILKELDDACSEVRNMSHSLNTVHIRNANFEELLNRFVENFERTTGIKVQLDFFPPEVLNQLSEEIKHQCYRIFQELTTNSKKHAGATQVTVGLILDDLDVILLVEDNGSGFDEDEKVQGIGLLNVRERVNRINGQIELHTKIGMGTSVSIRFPFQTNQYEDKNFTRR